ncbi:MAG: protein translocase subunit SecF [Thiotrichales bacterium]
MEFLKLKREIDFMRLRNAAFVFSILIFLVSIAAVAVRGLNFGIDFTGGTLVEGGYQETVPLERIRDALADGGFERSVVQYFGSSREILIRLPPQEGEANSALLSDRIIETLKGASEQAFEVKRVEFVGPQVGEELREDGGLALLFAFLGILVYVAFRFEWRLSVGAIVALLHDPVLIIGIFAVTQTEFDLTTLAALLAVIGYSINDTIVIYDRIREGFRKIRKGTPSQIVNTSINETLARTIMTSGSTLLVVLALYFLGGSAINGFALVLLIGIVVGTYSSIYVASNLALMLGLSRETLIPPEKKDEAVDQLP